MVQRTKLWRQKDKDMAKNLKVYPFREDLGKTDEELAMLAKNGDKDALEYLLKKYIGLVNVKVNKYFIIGAEREDIVQEGMIGLYKAVKNFEAGKQNSFKSFANLCVERQLITAIKTSNRQKHMPLNSSVSLNTRAYDSEDESFMEIFDAKTAEDPLDTITKKEYYEAIGNRIDEYLSDFEKQVLSRYAMRRKLCKNSRETICTSKINR